MPSFRSVLFTATSCASLFAAQIVSGQEAKSPHTVAQLYYYSIKDQTSFEEAYRHHLRWHADHNDKLAWYAWTIESGLRRGNFVDGTFGATFAALDARPDPSGDGADFVHNVSPYVVPLDSQIWTLWLSPSTATPLEDRRPGTTLDVFFLEVDPADVVSFESAIKDLAKTKRQRIQLSWYRMVRGDNLPTYLVLLTRKDLSDIERAGVTLREMIANAFATTSIKVDSALGHVKSIRTETWSYEPRLALIPGHPLEP